jgi:ribonucleotide reductase alpha subunit
MTEELLSYFKNDDLAASTWLNKYAQEGDKTPDQMHARMSREFARMEFQFRSIIEVNGGKDLSEYGQELWEKQGKMTLEDFEDEIYNLFKDFKYIVPQGSVMSQLGSKSIGSLSNCFIGGQPKDSYGGIFLKEQEMVQLMKRRGGVGIDLSMLRPTKTPTSNAAKTSTGMVSFMSRYSNGTREVAQDGRRGALMLSVDIKHPDALDFIKIKRDTSKITGANISVKLGDDFMRSVEANEDYLHCFPTDIDFNLKDFASDKYDDLYHYTGTQGKVYTKKTKAKELWGEIVKSAHQSAEPGILFWDNILNSSPDGVYSQFKPITTNPCVVGDTQILTSKGYFPIIDLVDTQIEVWNGEEFSEVTPKITGTDQEILIVSLSDGRLLKCTPYHSWYLWGGVKKEAKDLIVGDRVENYDSPLADESYNDEGGSIVSIEKQEGLEPFVYCFNEPKNHKGVFNGILTGQCGEVPMQEYDACRLIAPNLYSLVKSPFTENAEIDFDLVYKTFYMAMRLSDDLVELELEHIDRILDKIESDPEPEEEKVVERNLWKKVRSTAKNSRRTGLGFTALGDMLAAIGLKYDSDESILMIQKVMKTKFKAEWGASIDMAQLRGTFEDWDSSKEFEQVDGELFGTNKFYQMMIEEFPELTERMITYGRRNISVSTLAPTGTTSMMTQTTSGIEPVFAPWYSRRRKVNPNDKNAKIDFVDANGDAWEKFNVIHPKLREWINRTYGAEIVTANGGMGEEELKQWYEKSPYYKSTANDIDWIKRIEIQAMIQRYTSHSISSTINLPRDVSEEVVGNIYMESWKQGLKGVTVYRDGSRDGVLITEDKTEEITKFHENHAPPRAKSLEAKLVRFNNNKEKWIAFVGLLDGKPYEIFTGSLEAVKIPAKVEEGQIVKVRDENGVKRYDFVFEDGLVRGINNVFNDDYWNYAKMISSTLRHGMPLHFAVDMVKTLTFSEDHINTWKNGVARALKKFIPDGEALGLKCEDCGSTNVIFEEGCSRCRDCNSSKCS